MHSPASAASSVPRRAVVSFERHKQSLGVRYFSTGRFRCWSPIFNSRKANVAIGLSDHVIGSERTCPGVAAFDLQRRVLDAELVMQ